MVGIPSFDYYEEYLDLQPSLFRESDNLHKLFQSIFSTYDKQQQDFLWLSNNILNIDLAEGYHLDFIGNIVGQSRLLIGFNSEVYFGFEGSYKSETFGSKIDPLIGGYWNSRSHNDVSSSVRLSDFNYRNLIKAKIIYNQSNCTSNDLVEVVNLISNRNDNTVQTISHGKIKITTRDKTGLLNYFVSKLNTVENVLPVAAGVSIILGSPRDSENILGIYILTDLLEKLVNEDLPEATQSLN